MPLPFVSRVAPIALGLAALAGCSTAGAPPAPAQLPVQAPAQAASFCPPVVLREGTAILREGEGDALQYIASIAETSRSCRVENGALVIEVGIAGRVTPAVAARAGQTQLPLRVAVVRGSEVLYTNLGRLAVPVTPGSGPQPFAYVDRGIRIAEPAARNVNIQVGFDEQN